MRSAIAIASRANECELVSGGASREQHHDVLSQGCASWTRYDRGFWRLAYGAGFARTALGSARCGRFNSD